MKVLVTGGFGNVGRSTVNACLDSGFEVGIFEAPGAMARAKGGIAKLVRGRWKDCRYAFGDIRDPEAARRALALFPEGPDAVIHLAAIIPPLSERKPELAEAVNTGGTKNLIEACASSGFARKPRFVLASSIAIYGDRLDDYWISSGDGRAPDDHYGRTKVACEDALRASGLEWTILRLSYVVWSKWLPVDMTMFSVPPRTRLEVVHTEDAGRAFAAAARHPGAAGRVFDIGGGSRCRTVFRAYLDRMFRSFGLGDASFLPDELFARGDFHCGWYSDSDEADALLGFRRKTLEDYYDEVRWDTRFLRPLAWLAAPLVRARIGAASPFRKARAAEGLKPQA